MIGPIEPPRHVDMARWSATWDRIRANQAKAKAEEIPVPPDFPPGARVVVDEDPPRYEFPAAED